MAGQKVEQIKASIRELAEPLLEALGLDIWGLEVIVGPRTVVRIYIEAQAREEQAEPVKPVGIEKCAEVSRQLGLALEVEDIFPEAWVLEVSTPGLDRVFFSLEQMQAYLGDLIEAKLTSIYPQGPGGRKVWRGNLVKLSNKDLTIKPCEITSDDRIKELSLPEITLPWNLCRQVKRLALFPKPLKPGKGPAKS